MGKEEWRYIPGFGDRYQVSNWGNVKSMNYQNKKGVEHLMRLYLTDEGYHRVGLVKNKKQKNYGVHRLVALSFPEICGEWFEGCVVDHINTIRNDNRPENLRICTIAENNNNPMTRKRYSQANFISRIPFKKAVLQYSLDGKFIKEWPSCTEAGRELGFNKGNIYQCCKNDRGSSSGFLWRFKKTEVA